MRLVRQGPTLPAELSVNVERIWRQADGTSAHRYDRHWGSVFRKSAQRVERELKGGDGAALTRYVSGLVELGTAPTVAMG